MTPLSSLENHNEFIHRHIGPDEAEIASMLEVVDTKSLDALVRDTLPAGILGGSPVALPDAVTEEAALAEIRTIASKNVIARSFIGLGYNETITPKVILRNVMENPGWYTAYTPYQAEISQGRLQALLNFQQVVLDLTGLELANASLLDEATAGAEAMAMARRVSKTKSNRFFVDRDALPQTIDVMKTRAQAFGWELIFGTAAEAKDHEVFGALFQYPNVNGEIADLEAAIVAVKAMGGLTALATDPLALVLLKSPAALGADVALGSAQRFGVPMGFGGPHAAFFATKDEYKRSVPGRIIGVSVDSAGNPALRMALQTREQHIRREKANSNICTSQALLANMAGFYAVYHGPEGLKRIANRIHRLTAIFAEGLKRVGVSVQTRHFFDTVVVDLGAKTHAAYEAAQAAGYNLRHVSSSQIGISFGEQASRDDVKALWTALVGEPAKALDVELLDQERVVALPTSALRTDAILSHPVFNAHHTETEMLRFLKKLQNKDLALDHSMISLGSCTMKLNATAEMIPVTWPEFGSIHPFAPATQTRGYLELIEGLSEQLKAITGFDEICMQPNSGAQGEYAGLLAIRRYHEARGEGHRNICLIPQSAHGTNPATAQMMSMQVVVVACDESGNVNVADLKAKAEQHSANLACLMITYPSTHGVFEEAIREICDVIHSHGGQVYMDGANLNALVALVKPAEIGADVSHMNLHKTFCIPHGGGGPGMGPIGLKAHLAPYMANHVVTPVDGPHRGQSAVSAAPFGSASILVISWMYIRMMGGNGLKKATQTALLNANYMAKQLSSDYPVLYTGKNGRVAHECIIDLRPLKAETGVTEVDIAKRLMDFGFHAPTMSFPVPGTFMIEPTESESKAELDRFIEAMRTIRAEIHKVGAGDWPADNNPLRHAPHTQFAVIGQWERPYSREVAAYPLAWVRDNKFWPSVGRIDDAYGDRNVVCSCPSIDAYK
ncbi:aminomethyl-transferring glycine dehydrogenase [Chitinimonas sp. BJB300]|uniref:aminomethyl-transferring glycine dehydrogenase n=1 Tax=Chitinimonas sp. BJB300 TaxID=1559339 RepID=UPI000C11B832|nr:aminomethyl-transferring glycine dehydrogenase [Chitinimonas sp. BJB300]PHV10144.1 glycine dehydrogenase (aminomethyl-transferring) [Chitinimonas sp. BJB300]TSJ91154.1 aminomethyl-transferring glycine dehydrogenase [Chitinimonas sp. BJB300]